MSEPLTSVVISKWIVMGIWSIFGGIVHALTQHRRGTVKSITDGAILAFISGFAGMMWGLIAIKFYANDLVIVSFASGLGGFMSLEGLALVVNYVKKKFLTPQ